MTARHLIESAAARLRSGDRDGAAAALVQLLETDEDLGGRWAAVARMAMAIGEVESAVAALARLAEAEAGDEALLTQASMLAEAGRTHDALEVAERLAAAKPDTEPRIEHLLGTLKSQLARFDEARGHFNAALEIWPLSGPTWLSLAALVDYSLEPDELARLEAVQPKIAAAAPGARAAFLYALGKAQADCGEHAKAFSAFAKGAALVRPERVYDRRSAEAQVEALVGQHDAAAHASLVGNPTLDTSRPIFVTGIPRSGTTLVEQLLVRHDAVGDGAEVGLAIHLVKLVGGITPQAMTSFVQVSGGAEAAWQRVARLYLHLLEQRLPAQGRLVDKSLNNTRFLGLIGLALPDAPLVWVRRRPLDTAWSCFRTFFAKGLNWSWDLEDIAHHIRLEQRLLDHWQQVLGKRLLVLDYEELVADAEGQGRRLLAHCGLAQQSLESFEASDRAIATSSVAQVRRPLYTSSVGAAEPYRRWLEPFLQAYETFYKTVTPA